MTRTFRIWLCMIVASVVAVLLMPVTSYAATDPGAGGGDEVFTLEASTVRLLVAFVLPALVGLLAKATWAASIKGAILLVLNAVTAAVIAATMFDGRAVWSEATLRETLLQLAISVASYYSLIKPVGAFSGFKVDGTPGKLNTVGVH